MRNKVLLNILMNSVLGVLFVFLNNWALKSSLEETFVSLALLYSVVVILINAIYVYLFCKK